MRENMLLHAGQNWLDVDEQMQNDRRPVAIPGRIDEAASVDCYIASADSIDFQRET